MSATNDAIVTTGLWKRIRKTVAGISAAALVGGLIVVGGFGAQSALAATAAPTVSVGGPQSYIWGEDLPLDITIEGTAGAGAQYNVSVGVRIPANAQVQDTGTLGTPVTYSAGDVLPGQIVNPNAADPAETCETLGLADTDPESNTCRVPANSQYLMFENIHDLPEGASASHTLTLRPNAEDFQIGEDVPYQVNVYTNGDERFLPVFPGSTGVNNAPARAKSSNAGQTGNDLIVNALRITKSETTHPENEVLRGVHGNRGAIYELRIEHTGEADISAATVVDYLPAGLEYLGSCGLDDSTTNANGTQGEEEYEDSDPLNTTSVGTDCLAEASIETVRGSLDSEGRFTASDSGDVFTAITWNVGEWLMENPGGAVQLYPGTEGTAAETVIRYRAGVPLYENTMDFGETTPSPASLEQGANLNNNRGASTRHGTDNLDARSSSDGAGAIGYTNGVIASGEYNGETVSDSTTESIDAVDVRIVKTVNGGEPGSTGEFLQGGVARYSLALATSEYVSAQQGDPSQRPLRIVDDMANGLCPVFGPKTEIWTEDGSEASKPKFVLGTYNPTPSGAPVIDNPDATTAEWNDALAAANVDTVCGWNESTASTNSAKNDESLDGGKLVSIAFSPAEGNFYLELALENDEVLNAPDRAVNIDYSVHQNSAYIKDSDVPEGGATTSRDIFENEAEINLRTTPINAILGIGTPGMSEAEQARLDAPWNAWDDSDAFLQAGTTTLDKKVLERGAVPARQDVWKSQTDGGPEADRWVDVATAPFAAGDKTWYRLVINPPDGADVRNPVLTDFLPEGVSFDAESLNSTTGRYEDMFVVPNGWETGLPTIGSGACADPSWTPEPGETLNGSVIPSWLNVFVPNDGISLNGNVLTFDLGATGQQCGISNGATTDRFLPFEKSLEIYLLVTITDPSAFAEVDLPQNLAKYQQENDEGEIWFLREDAQVEVDRTPRLLKGVTSVKDNDGDVSSTREAATQGSGNGTEFNSNRDGIEVVQGEEVTYRLDVTAPYNETTDYLIWDVLPEGIKAIDVVADRTAKLVVDGDSGADVTFAAEVYDSPYTGAPSNVTGQLKSEYGGRSLIVWNVTGVVPGSSKAVPAVTDEDGDIVAPEAPAVERGLTLGYTVTVPSSAQVTQTYDNDASIVEFSTVNNGVGTTAVIIDSDENVANPRVPTELAPGYVFEDTANDTSDPSNVFLPGATLEKTLVSSQIDAAAGTVGNGVDIIAPDAAHNSANQIVQGEFVTFDYTVTIPANTSVEGGRLVDLANWKQFTSQTGTTSGGSVVPYFFESVEYFSNKVGSAPAPLTCGTAPTEFSCEDTFRDPAGFGALLFPEVYQNSDDVDEQFTARITMWIEQDLTHDRWLENTARFDYINPNDASGTARSSMEDSERVQYIEPNPSIAKAVTAVADRDSAPVTFDSADPIVPESGSVTYTLTASNADSRPALFDGVIYDCVPDGLAVSSGSFVSNNGTATVVAGKTCELTSDGDVVLDSDGTPKDAGDGTVIKWELDNPLVPGTNAALSYTATVDPEAGGGQVLRNGAHLRGYTIPEGIDGSNTVTESANERRDHRDSRAREDVRLASAGLTKTVSPEEAPVGETVTYTLTTTLPADANYYDVALWDELPIGLEYVNGSAEVDFSDNWPAATDPVDPASAPTITGPTVSVSSDKQRLDWTIDPQDVGTFSEVRTVTITFDAKITAHEDLAASPRNTAFVAWNNVDRDDDNDDPRDHEVPATADVTILNPEVNIEKKIDTETPINEDSISVNPDEGFVYQLRVFQTSQGNTPAHDITVVDNVPAGVIIDTSTLTIDGDPAGGQVVWDSGVADGTGGTITWTLTSTLHQQAGEGAPKQILLGYSGEFIESTGLSARAYENYVNVTLYKSLDDDDGWVYTPPQRAANGDLGTPGTKPGGTNVPAANDDADVTPLFPQVDPVKTVSPQQLAPGQGPDGYGLAYVETDFNWTLTITNNGAGVANAVDVIDTLPVNWDYVDGSVTVNGVSYPALNPAETGSLAAGLKLTWSADDLGVVDGLFPLAAGDSFVITFNAQPTEAAIDVVGTGLPAGGPAHTNTVAVDHVKDADGNERNLDVDDYAGSPDTADAYIAEADLKLEKVAIGGTDADLALSNSKTLPAGTWVPGAVDGVTIGGSSVTYTQPQWQLTVNNYGPDASFGEFTLVDTQTLPAGVEVLSGGWSARYYSNAADTAGTPVSVDVNGTGTAADPYVLTLGDTTTSLSAGPKVGGKKTAGEDRIVVTANVSIAAGALATGNELMNVADVAGQTFERESNKGPDADNPNVDEANKPLESAADLAIVKSVATDEAELGAGKPISWDLQVSNHGPSTSLSGTDKITVTDVIPDGISGVTDPSNATWLAEMSRPGDAAATWPARAGDTITWTYQGAAITPGQTIPVITLSGSVNTDWEGEIDNVATVTPGDTPDPFDPNNEDEVPFTPDNGTTISIDKTRVVKNAADEWVAAGALDPAPAPVPGENVSYRITVTNHGPAVARGVHVTDELESYLSFVSKEDIVGEWSTTNVAGDTSLRFDLDAPALLASPVDLEDDDESNVVQFILTTKLDSDFVLDDDSFVFNEATADAENAEPDTDEDKSNEPSRDAQLTIVKTHSGDPIAGTSIPYTLTVTNNGPSASRGPIVITDELPTGLSYVADSATVSVGGAAAQSIATDVNADGDVLTWSVGDATDSFTLPVHSETVNGTIVITLNVLIDAEITNGVKPNGATVDGPDGPPDEDTDEIVIEREADMSLTKKVKNAYGDWVDEANVVAGDEVEYLLTVTNDGPSANPANLIDELPTHLTLVSVTPLDATTGWDCTASVVGSQLASCTNPLVPLGTTEFLVVTKLAAEAVAGEAGQTAEFVNEATLSWFDRDSTDPDTPNTSEDDAKITATAEADLVLQKRTWNTAGEAWVDAALATAGEQATYRVDVRNDGPSDVIAPLEVTDLLPAGVAFNTLRSAETFAFWEAAPGVVDVSTGQQTVVFTPNDATVGLKTGESLPPLRYIVDIDPTVAAGDTLVNLAVVTSGTTETDDTNNSDIAEINVERQIDLGIVKTHDADVVRIGDVLPFTIDVTNHGPSEASGIVVTDSIPAGLEFVSDLGPVLDENGDPTGWQIDSITLAEPGDNTVDPVIPANPAGGATVVASYAHPLAPNESAAPLVINTLVTPAAYETVTNVVNVVGNEPEPDPDTENPNRDEDPVIVPPQVTLVVEKTAVGDWQVGKNGSYQITVDNLGPTANPGPITVTDELPNGLSYIDSPNLPAGVTVATSGKTVTWTIENGLAVDESVLLQLTVHVAQAAYPEVTNVVVIDSPAEKTPESVLQDDETVTVAAADPLVVTGGDLALGVLTAAALLLLLGGATYAASRRTRGRARYGA